MSGITFPSWWSKSALQRLVACMASGQQLAGKAGEPWLYTPQPIPLGIRDESTLLLLLLLPECLAITKPLYSFLRQ